MCLVSCCRRSNSGSGPSALQHSRGGKRPGPAPWSHCPSSAGGFCPSVLHPDTVHRPVQAGLPSGSEEAWLPGLRLWGEQGRARHTLLSGGASGRAWASAARAGRVFLGTVWCGSCPWGTTDRWGWGGGGAACSSEGRCGERCSGRSGDTWISGAVLASLLGKEREMPGAGPGSVSVGERGQRACVQRTLPLAAVSCLACSP